VVLFFEAGGVGFDPESVAGTIEENRNVGFKQ
jgi:hypothetical protein